MTRTTLKTPTGIAVYPRLEVPDTKFDADGVYSIKLRLSSEEGQPLVDSILAMQQEASKEAIEENSKLPKEKQKGKLKMAKLADLPFVQDDETGDYLINFKMKAKVTSKKDKKEYTFKPAIFDAKGVPAKDTRVGGGSLVKVAYEMGKFFTVLLGAGVTLRLRGVQIIEYKAYEGGASAEALGFEEEDGWKQPVKEDADAGDEAGPGLDGEGAPDDESGAGDDF